jgi:hypothetical protein
VSAVGRGRALQKRKRRLLVQMPVVTAKFGGDSDEVSKHECAVAQDGFSGAMAAPEALQTSGASGQSACD